MHSLHFCLHVMQHLGWKNYLERPCILQQDFNLAGFLSVIATMWAIQDENSPKVVDYTYRYLFLQWIARAWPFWGCKQPSITQYCVSEKIPMSTVDLVGPVHSLWHLILYVSFLYRLVCALNSVSWWPFSVSLQRHKFLKVCYIPLHSSSPHWLSLLPPFLAQPLLSLSYGLYHLTQVYFTISIA